MALEDMSINEVLVRYLHNMAEIGHLESENSQISTTTDSIQEPRYVENLAQWEEYRTAKQEITRLTEERIANNNEKREALLKEQQDIRAFLLHNESVPKDKWIRCADDGVYVPSDTVNGEPTVRVAPWEHVIETNGEPERLHDVRREKEASYWGRVQSTLRHPRFKPTALVVLVILIGLTLGGGGEGLALGISIIGVLATWWFLETRKQLQGAREQLHRPETSEQLSVARTDTVKPLMGLLHIVIAIVLPPLAVLLQVGIGKQFWINVLLTIFGYLPGVVHAVWVIAKYY